MMGMGDMIIKEKYKHIKLHFAIITYIKLQMMIKKKKDTSNLIVNTLYTTLILAKWTQFWWVSKYIYDITFF